MKNLSPLQIERLQYQPKLPQSLENGISNLVCKEGSATQSVANQTSQLPSIALWPNYNPSIFGMSKTISRRT